MWVSMIFCFISSMQRIWFLDIIIAFVLFIEVTILLLAYFVAASENFNPSLCGLSSEWGIDTASSAYHTILIFLVSILCSAIFSTLPIILSITYLYRFGLNEPHFLIPVEYLISFDKSFCSCILVIVFILESSITLINFVSTRSLNIFITSCSLAWSKIFLKSVDETQEGRIVKFNCLFDYLSNDNNYIRLWLVLAESLLLFRYDQVWLVFKHNYLWNDFS